MHNAPAVDLLVGSVLFRDAFLSGGRGHADLPRLSATGYRVVGLTVATTWPDVEGSLSRWHFRSLGLPSSAVRSPFAVARWLIGRIEHLCAASDGKLVVIRTSNDLDLCLADGGPVGILLGVQGGHVLEGDLRNVGRLRELGVRMFAPAHVMDNDVVGSGTGKRAAGVTDFGHAVIQELEAQQVEELRRRRLEIQARDLESAASTLSSTGFDILVIDQTIYLSEARAVDAPDKVAALLVAAGTAPTRLAVEQENLEDYFLRLTGEKV